MFVAQAPLAGAGAQLQEELHGTCTSKLVCWGSCSGSLHSPQDLNHIKAYVNGHPFAALQPLVSLARRHSPQRPANGETGPCCSISLDHGAAPDAAGASASTAALGTSMLHVRSRVLLLRAAEDATTPGVVPAAGHQRLMRSRAGRLAQTGSFCADLQACGAPIKFDLLPLACLSAQLLLLSTRHARRPGIGANSTVHDGGYSLLLLQRLPGTHRGGPLWQEVRLQLPSLQRQGSAALVQELLWGGPHALPVCSGAVQAAATAAVGQRAAQAGQGQRALWGALFRDAALPALRSITALYELLEALPAQGGLHVCCALLRDINISLACRDSGPDLCHPTAKAWLSPLVDAWSLPREQQVVQRYLGDDGSVAAVEVCGRMMDGSCHPWAAAVQQADSERVLGCGAKQRVQWAYLQDPNAAGGVMLYCSATRMALHCGRLVTLHGLSDRKQCELKEQLCSGNGNKLAAGYEELRRLCDLDLRNGSREPGFPSLNQLATWDPHRRRCAAVFGVVGIAAVDAAAVDTQHGMPVLREEHKKAVLSALYRSLVADFLTLPRQTPGAVLAAAARQEQQAAVSARSRPAGGAPPEPCSHPRPAAASSPRTPALHVGGAAHAIGTDAAACSGGAASLQTEHHTASGSCGGGAGVAAGRESTAGVTAATEDAWSTQCLMCDDGGDLVMCDDCHVALHCSETCNPLQVDQPGQLYWALTREGVVEKLQCPCCLPPARPHPCFKCKEEGQEGSALQRCAYKGCMRFYHARCMASRSGTGELICALHTCAACGQKAGRCGQPPVAADEGLPASLLVPCRRCPKAFHLGCVPQLLRGASPARLWLPVEDQDGDKPCDAPFLYCLDHHMEPEETTPEQGTYRPFSDQLLQAWKHAYKLLLPGIVTGQGPSNVLRGTGSCISQRMDHRLSAAPGGAEQPRRSLQFGTTEAAHVELSHAPLQCGHAAAAAVPPPVQHGLGGGAGGPRRRRAQRHRSLRAIMATCDFQWPAAAVPGQSQPRDRARVQGLGRAPTPADGMGAVSEPSSHGRTGTGCSAPGQEMRAQRGLQPASVPCAAPGQEQVALAAAGEGVAVPGEQPGAHSAAATAGDAALMQCELRGCGPVDNGWVRQDCRETAAAAGRGDVTLTSIPAVDAGQAAWEPAPAPALHAALDAAAMGTSSAASPAGACKRAASGSADMLPRKRQRKAATPQRSWAATLRKAMNTADNNLMVLQQAFNNEQQRRGLLPVDAVLGDVAALSESIQHTRRVLQGTLRRLDGAEERTEGEAQAAP